MPDCPSPHPSIARARKIATLLDSAIPIPFSKKKIGLDPILGLLPGGGDFITALLSGYIVWVAYELKLPTVVLARMVLNLTLDFMLGTVPVLGDIADAFWKANQLNLKLLESAYTYQLQQNTEGRVVDTTAERV